MYNCYKRNYLVVFDSQLRIVIFIWGTYRTCLIEFLTKFFTEKNKNLYFHWLISHHCHVVFWMIYILLLFLKLLAAATKKEMHKTSHYWWFIGQKIYFSQWLNCPVNFRHFWEYAPKKTCYVTWIEFYAQMKSHLTEWVLKLPCVF